MLPPPAEWNTRSLDETSEFLHPEGLHVLQTTSDTQAWPLDGASGQVVEIEFLLPKAIKQAGVQQADRATWLVGLSSSAESEIFVLSSVYHTTSPAYTLSGDFLLQGTAYPAPPFYKPLLASLPAVPKAIALVPGFHLSSWILGSLPALYLLSQLWHHVL
jgi:hypothetical protein